MSMVQRGDLAPHVFRDGHEVYLGDGLYARFDGFSVWLRAPRRGGDHVVALEPEVLESLEAFVHDLRAWARREAEAQA